MLLPGVLGKGGGDRSGVARLVERLRCGEPPVPAAGHATPHGAPQVRTRARFSLFADAAAAAAAAAMLQPRHHFK